MSLIFYTSGTIESKVFGTVDSVSVSFVQD